MTEEQSTHQALVPFTLEGVIVGKVLLDEHGHLAVVITAPGTHEYFKKLLLGREIESFSVKVDYSKLHQTRAPNLGHLNLVRE